MFICHCRAVTDTAVARAVDAGANTLADVCATTGAGQSCGTCVFSVKRVMRAHQESRIDAIRALPTPA
jgi:bacterioferritin-associated ferredoxin